ncbi:MAG TPA: sporulation protein YqfD, partial [Bacillales bacterium]|nr:sporulation protein YqfD [Bacillales bacterium]
FLRWELPVTFISKNYLQTETDKRTYTKEQALEKAKQLGRKDLRNKLGPHDKIKSEKVLRETVENGKVKVLMYYTVIENIAVEQPLIDNKETE